MSTAAVDGDRSIGELFGELANETGALVRQQVKLAATEITQKAMFAGKQVIYVGMGAFVGLLALEALLAAAIVGLASAIPLWAAALAVGGVLAMIATLLGVKAIGALKHMDPIATQTLMSLEDNKSWLKKEMQ